MINMAFMLGMTQVPHETTIVTSSCGNLFRHFSGGLFRETGKNTGEAGDVGHFQNFIDAVRGDAKLNCEIEEGHKTTLLCHLGNIAWRTGRTVHFDTVKRKITGDPDAEHLWTREYRAGWEPKV